MDSRIISYPDHLDKTNHTVVLVDPSEKMVTDLAYFLQTSRKEYDVYVYLGEHHDLEYLKLVTDLAERVFISEVSQVKIVNATNVETYTTDAVPLGYFAQVDND